MRETLLSLTRHKQHKQFFRIKFKSNKMATFGSEADVLNDTGSLPMLQSKSPLNTVGSRKPLSCSQAEALNDILSDGPFSMHSCIKSKESGYFSKSSKLSLCMTTNQGSLAEKDGMLAADQMDTFNQEKLEALLIEIAEEFGGCWKELGRHLLKKECSIENINTDYCKVSEKSYQMLHKWFVEKGSKASVQEIFKCLIHIGKEEVAERILGYLPELIAGECEIILLSSPRKIRCKSMTTPIYNITELHKDLTVEKQLQLQEDEEVYVCFSNITKKRYLLKEIEESHKTYKWAARMLIPEKELKIKMKHLRKTTEFLKDLQLKEDTARHLKNIIEKLQEKVHLKHIAFCHSELKCTNCEKTGLMRELLDKDLSLLHHELVKMLRGTRRLSVIGISTDRIYSLAQRAYALSEEHKKFHQKVVKPTRRCSMELLDSDGTETEPDEINDPLQCTLNILRHLGRKRKVVQSLTIKERKKQTHKVQRHWSEKNKTRFYIPVKGHEVEHQETTASSNWPTRMGSKIFRLRKKSSERNHDKNQEPTPSSQTPQVSQQSFKNRVTENIPKHMFHSRSNTFPSSLADLNTSVVQDCQEFYRDDIEDSVFCMKNLKISEVKSRGTEDEKHMSVSDSNLCQLASQQNGMTRNQLTANSSRSPGMFETLSQRKFLDSRQRSFSDNDGISHRDEVFHHNGSSAATVQQTSHSMEILWKKEIDPVKIFYV